MRGRDAASAGLTTIFGRVQALPVVVQCSVAGAAAPQSAGIRIE